ncbi:uncharacterized protein BKA55DRAFT_510123 [Fusarium redolens]|uniref:Uncharacterized protein n=1 Tax=Fusarium redolens TaxID=48865 RepID=A0A9P9KIW6_FUSRE|nr:uncharacterized protein BKA55DRAFT_510123 [Fusarium redolens]KAH7254249.1 hypothetical protein BKA55DRAFT_510123 [Fusarium redolens]
MTDQTPLYGTKFAELVADDVSDPPPAENAVNAKLTSIDGTGTAVLASNLFIPEDKQKYGGFALILKDDSKYDDFRWVQFITRQLVINGAAQTGSLSNKVNKPAYQLVNSTENITDFATGSGAPNWNTCWGVDSALAQIFFADTHEFVKSAPLKLNGIMDTPSVLIGKLPQPYDREYFLDAPSDLVDMKKLATGPGTSRAYFSDYLVKKLDGSGYRIYARFDSSLTWNAGEVDKKNFEIRSLSSTATNAFLNCHRAALLHTTTPLKEGSVSQQPYADFLNSIVP